MKKLKLPQPKRKDADRTPQHHFSAAKLAYMAFLCVTMSLVFCQPAFAATDVWSKAKEIMQDVLSLIHILNDEKQYHKWHINQVYGKCQSNGENPQDLNIR